MADASLEQLEKFLDNHPDINLFEVMLTDLNGQLRGKWIERNKIAKVLTGGIKLPLSSTLFDIWGRDPADFVFDNGDADGICVPVLSSLSPVPWIKEPTAQLLVTLQDAQGKPCGYDPRVLLYRQQQRLLAMGFQPVIAFEMEFYLFKKERQLGAAPSYAQRHTNAITAVQTYGIDEMREMADFLLAVRSACQTLQLPIDTIISEAAPSQYEINLDHQPDALLAADQALLLKRVIQGVARQQGLHASFMAKPFGDQAGSGMHLHCSLLDNTGKNVFDSGDEAGTPLLKQGIGGCLYSLTDSMLLLAPHANSFRRFQPESHAPLYANWGYENRTVALRVPVDNPAATRIEHRVAGADANPYLAAAALLAGIHMGIERKIECPPEEVGNGYVGGGTALPQHWNQALSVFSESDFIADYFGKSFRKVMTAVKAQEINTFNSVVTPLEYDTYL